MLYVYLTSFLLFLLFSIISCDDQFLKIPVTINDNGIPTISIDIGIPHQSFSFLLSSTLSGVLIISNKNTMGGYDETKSHSFKSLEPIKLSYIEANAEGRIAKDSLTINTPGHMILYSDYKFVLIDQVSEPFYFKGAIGFEYQTPKGDTLSLFKRLYNDNMLYRNVFYMEKTEKETNLILGAYPNYYVKKSKYPYCDLIKKEDGEPNTLWQCNLHLIYFDDFTMNIVNEPVTFSIGDKYNCVNNELYEIIKKRVFTDAMQNKICYEKENKRYNQIVCRSTFQFDDNLIISYIIDKMNIKYNIKNLFVEKDE